MGRLLAALALTAVGVASAQEAPEVHAAMAIVAPRVAACGEHRQVARARLTFRGHDGRVTEVELVDPLPDTVSACVRRQAAKAVLRPFGQRTFRVVYPFRVGSPAS
jgi:hypothetical protein